MPSLFAGTDPLICDALRIEDRKHLNHKSAKLEPLSDETAFRLVQRLYCRIVDNFPGQARSPSEQLWRCRRATHVCPHNTSPEKTLEKAVAILADQGHMPGWFNQCPVATGIADPRDDGNRSVDLVHLCGPTLRLVELKWPRARNSDTLPFALFEVLEYGLAHLLARLHKRELHLQAQPLMQDSVHHVRLEVVAPREFFRGTSRHRDLFSRMHNALARFAKAQTNGDWSMSLHALVFPDSFDTVPFDSGKAVKEVCTRRPLSPEGRAVCDAFANLAPLPPDRFLPGVPGPDIERILKARPARNSRPESSTDPVAVDRVGDVGPGQGANLAPPHPGHEEEPRDHGVRGGRARGRRGSDSDATAAGRWRGRRPGPRPRATAPAPALDRRRSAGEPARTRAVVSPAGLGSPARRARKRSAATAVDALEGGLSPARGARRGSRPRVAARG